MKVSAVRVSNIDLSKKDFDKLCDELSRLRIYAHDYRMVSDFDESKYPLYWQSGTYDEASTPCKYMDLMLEDITTNIDRYFDLKSVKVEMVSYLVEEIR